MYKKRKLFGPVEIDIKEQLRRNFLIESEDARKELIERLSETESGGGSDFSIFNKDQSMVARFRIIKYTSTSSVKST